MIRSAWFLTLVLFVGCGVSSSVTYVNTTTPNKAQIAECRQIMYINPKITIEPLGYATVSGMDDEIRFKFTALTDDPATLFDSTQIDSTKFVSNFNPSSLQPSSPDLSMLLQPNAPKNWWDVSVQTVSGGSFRVPPPNAKGTRGLNIAYKTKDDGTLTVYVLWHEK